MLLTVFIVLIGVNSLSAALTTFGKIPPGIMTYFGPIRSTFLTRSRFELIGRIDAEKFDRLIKATDVDLFDIDSTGEMIQF